MANNSRIYLSPPHMGGKEQDFIKGAFDTNWIAPLGPNVDAFEKSLAKFCNVRYAAVLSSGTAAIHMALILLNVKPGDEVLASTFTFSATINPILYQGAVPVLIDSEPSTWNMDPELLETAIKERIKRGKLPKAIIPVHLYGMPCKMNEITEIAKKYGIPVIEDAAEALGSTYFQRPAGSFGKMAILSFNGNKIITTSGGGALLSDEEELIKKARFLSSQARDNMPYYQHSQLGYNYRMSNILAGVGLGQMDVIEKRVQKRRENYFFYKKNLEKFDFISFLEEPDDSFFSNHWLTSILFNSKSNPLNPGKLINELDKENIESRHLWKPMHLQPVFSSYPAYLSGISEHYFRNGLCLPSGSSLTDQDKERILKVVMKCLNKEKHLIS